MLIYMLYISLLMCAACAEKSETLQIKMPGVRPPRVDTYMYTALKVPKEAYVVKYEALAEASTAHHILLYGCSIPAQTNPSWVGGSQACGGDDESIMYAWAKNAQSTQLPPDVGFHIGGDSGINYIVMNVHYARTLDGGEPDDESGLQLAITTVTPRYQQGVILMVSGHAAIPPHTPSYSVDISCAYDGEKTLHPFSFRTHAHSLSRVISGYKLNSTAEGGYELLGKGNPQWPQMFYPMTSSHTIYPDDRLVGRCVYNSTSMDHIVEIGSTHNDEMCNFYMMYYTEGNADFILCFNDQYPNLSKKMPATSIVPLPPNATLDEQAMGHHHHGMHGEDKSTNAPGNVHVGSVDGTGNFHQTPEGQAIPLLTEVDGWFGESQHEGLGQVAGIDVDKDGNTVIFHRADRIWEADTFDLENKLKPELGPITARTLWKINDDGTVIDKWADNMFYLPHGLTIDHDDNIWLTDVAMHQVFKFNSTNRKTPLLTVGVKLTPGSDETHFCKPTDVAVRSDGTFYVSDGYCNSRIIQFDGQGHFVRKWGSQDETEEAVISKVAHNMFAVPHGLALSEKLKTLCVADREYFRVQCFDLEGNFKFMYRHDARVFGIAFRADTDKMILIDANQATHQGTAYLMHYNEDKLEKITPFKPSSTNFGEIHDVAVSRDGRSAHIASVKPNDAFKFIITINDGADPLIHNQAKPSLSDHRSIGSGSDMANNKPSTPAGSQMVPILVGCLLVVPIVIVLFVLIGYKICSNRNRGVSGQFDMGNMFKRNDRAGFAPLTEQEDHYTDTEDDISAAESKHIIP